MTVSISRSENDQNLFPLYIFLARLVSDGTSSEVREHVHMFKFAESYSIILLLCYNLMYLYILNKQYSSVYRFNRACMLTTEIESRSQVQANFVLPDINKLASEVKSGSICILLVSFGMD